MKIKKLLNIATFLILILRGFLIVILMPQCHFIENLFLWELPEKLRQV